MMEYSIFKKDDITLIESTAIRETGIARAFFTTALGNRSCNLYKKNANIERDHEDFLDFCKAIEANPRSVITNRLIYHTSNVREVSETDLEDYDIFDEPSAWHGDGLITKSKKICLHLYSADCPIICYVDAKNEIIGCNHASWRCSLGSVFQNTVSKMVELGSDPRDIVCCVFPCISKEYFEVGNEVADIFIKEGFADFVDMDSYEKPHIDLVAVDKAIIKSCGVKAENIHSIDLCTYHEKELLHSYRRGPVVSENNQEKHLNGMNGFFLKFL